MNVNLAGLAGVKMLLDYIAITNKKRRTSKDILLSNYDLKTS